MLSQRPPFCDHTWDKPVLRIYRVQLSLFLILFSFQCVVHVHMADTMHLWGSSYPYSLLGSRFNMAVVRECTCPFHPFFTSENDVFEYPYHILSNSLLPSFYSCSVVWIWISAGQSHRCAPKLFVLFLFFCSTDLNLSRIVYRQNFRGFSNCQGIRADFGLSHVFASALTNSKTVTRHLSIFRIAGDSSDSCPELPIVRISGDFRVVKSFFSRILCQTFIKVVTQLCTS